jgi:hypothetical protein
MNVTERYRSTIEELTEGRSGRPDLADVITRGRRKRRARRTLVAVGAVGALTVAGFGGAWLNRPAEVVAVDNGFASSPSYQDFVPGTGVDEAIQAAVAAHLAGVPEADKVYPSDWNRDTPLPDAQAQNATDWEAHYPVGAHEGLVVSMFKAIPGHPAHAQCRPSMDNPGLPCSTITQPDGSTLLTYGFTIGSVYRLVTERLDTDGFVVQAFDDVQAGSWGEAEAGSSLVQKQLDALVNDPAMTFADPVVTPHPPSGK